MMNRRTRQRQGRDFEAPDNPLKTAEMAIESNCNMLDGVINNTKACDDSKESVLTQLEDFRKQAETMAPVDGHEPPQRVL